MSQDCNFLYAFKKISLGQRINQVKDSGIYRRKKGGEGGLKTTPNGQDTIHNGLKNIVKN